MPAQLMLLSSSQHMLLDACTIRLACACATGRLHTNCLERTWATGRLHGHVKLDTCTLRRLPHALPTFPLGTGPMSV